MSLSSEQLPGLRFLLFTLNKIRWLPYVTYKTSVAIICAYNGLNTCLWQDRILLIEVIKLLKESFLSLVCAHVTS